MMLLDLEAIRVKWHECMACTTPLDKAATGKIAQFLLLEVRDVINELAAARAEIAELEASRQALLDFIKEVCGGVCAETGQPCDLCCGKGENPICPHDNDKPNR